MGAYIPGPAQVGQTQVNPANGFAPQPAMPQNGFAQQGPMPRPNPMRQPMPQPGTPQGPMPTQQPNPMLGGAGMQQPGQPSMTDRLMSPAGQIGLSMMAQGPSFTPVNPMAGIGDALNNSARYQRQKEVDAQNAELKQQQLAIQAAKLGQGTALQRDFEYLKKQGYSNEEAMGMLRKGTTIDMGAGDDKQLDQLGKMYAQDFMASQQAGKAAATNLARYEQLGELLSAPGVYTGTGGQATLALKKAGEALGFDIEGVADSEAANALANRMALALRNPAGGEGMPGAMSDADRRFLVESVPGLTNSLEGNKMLIDIFTRMEQRKIAEAGIARRYLRQNGGVVDEGMYEALQTHADENPLFEGMNPPSGEGAGLQLPKGITEDAILANVRTDSGTEQITGADIIETARENNMSVEDALEAIAEQYGVTVQQLTGQSVY